MAARTEERLTAHTWCNALLPYTTITQIRTRKATAQDIEYLIPLLAHDLLRRRCYARVSQPMGVRKG